MQYAYVSSLNNKMDEYLVFDALNATNMEITSGETSTYI